MKTVMHAMFGMLSFGIVLGSLVASLVVEFWYSPEEISYIKSLNLESTFLFLTCLAIAALLGLSLGRARKGNIVNAKEKRVVWIFAIAILFLLPIAYVLKLYAKQGQFNWLYFVLQAAEYVFDIITLILLGLNIKDGNILVRQSQGDLNRSDI